jgi:hypothetical protein
VDAAELSASATRLVSGLKCEVVLQLAEASLQRSFVRLFRLMASSNFLIFAAFISVDCFWWKKFTQSQKTVSNVCSAYGEIFNFLFSERMRTFPTQGVSF